MTDTTSSTTTPVTWPAHDPATWRNVPASSAPIDPERVAALLAAEWERFAATTPGSAAHHARALGPLPLGVPSSFQHWDPYPVAITSAKGAWLTDCRRPPGARPVDGLRRDARRSPQPRGRRRGHSVALDDIGTLFVTPSPIRDRGRRALPAHASGSTMLRFANSGTEATMYALRTARAFTGRKAIIKIEGGYHGGYDALQVSVKPDVADAGPEDAPDARHAVRGRGRRRPCRALQRPRAPRAALRPVRLRASPASSWSRCSRTSASSCPTPATLPACAHSATHTTAARVRRGEDRSHRGLRRCLAAARSHARPGRAREEHQRWPAARGLRRPCRGDGLHHRRPHAALRHLQRQPTRRRRGPRRSTRSRRRTRSAPPRRSTWAP